MTLAAGAVVGGYRVERLIGRGGMGAVYEATQLSLSRKVALKVIAPHLGDDPSFRERFRREGVVQGNLEHPHIVPIYEAGESDDQLFLAMRLVRGANLKDLVTAETLTPPRTIAILTQVAGALDTAHLAGLIHRDIKPQNILVDESDYAYLADFGLTKMPGEGSLTKTGQNVGSLDYISPEQIRHEPPSRGSDVYAFAAVLYECLSGVVPYPRDSEAALLYAHLEEQPPPVAIHHPELPPSVDGVIRKAMAKDPEQRHASAGELMDELERALGTEEIGAPPLVQRRRAPETIADPTDRPTASVGVATSGRRIPALRIAAATLVAGAVVGGAFVLGHSNAGAVPEATARLAAPNVSATVPASWRPAPAPKIPGLKLTTGRAAGSGKARIAVGSFEADGPKLLPAPFLRRLTSSPQPRRVRLGALAAYHYPGLRVRGLAQPVSLFVIPTSMDVATVLCVGPAGPACANAARTVRVVGVTPYAPGPSADYANRLRKLVVQLNTSAKAGQVALAKAGTANAQATAAIRLAAAFSTAAKAAAALPARPVETARTSALLGSLRKASAAYTALAAAARAKDEDAYARAGTSAAATRKSVARALAGLEPLGYR